MFLPYVRWSYCQLLSVASYHRSAMSAVMIRYRKSYLGTVDLRQSSLRKATEYLPTTPGRRGTYIISYLTRDTEIIVSRSL